MPKIEFPEFPDVEIKSHPQSKRPKLSWRPGGPIKMSYPAGIPKSWIYDFLLNSLPWIEAVRERQLELAKDFYNPDKLPELLRGKWVLKKASSFKISRRKHDLHLFYPAEQNWQDADVQDLINKAVANSYKAWVEEFLIPRTLQFAQQVGIEITGVKVKTLKTRWGSCSSKGEIVLNSHLAKLPEHLQNYVIWHEITHRIHMNHSALFWRQLGRFCPGALSLDKELKKFSTLKV